MSLLLLPVYLLFAALCVGVLVAQVASSPVLPIALGCVVLVFGLMFVPSKKRR